MATDNALKPKYATIYEKLEKNYTDGDISAIWNALCYTGWYPHDPYSTLSYPGVTMEDWAEAVYLEKCRRE